MSDRLFNRLPDAAVGPVFDMLRERLEGGRDYVPPPAAPEMAAVRAHLRTLSPAQLEAAYKAQSRKLAPPLAPRSPDAMRAVAVGGGLPGGRIGRAPTYETLFAEHARALGR